MPPPDISVIISVYNGARYLAQAIDSVLGQVAADFELVIIDDGSTDETPAILARYAARDDRIVLLRNDRNLGIAESRNRALTVARGALIAPMDSDDICLPHRLQRQQQFLRAHPQVGVVGCTYQLIDAEGKPLPHAARVPLTHPCCVWMLLYLNPLAHPSVMMQRAVLEGAGGYRLTHNSQHDLDLWCRIFNRTTFANLPEMLFQYRRHASQVTSNMRSDEINQMEVASRQLVYTHLLGEPADPPTITYLINQRYPNAQAALQAMELLDRLWDAMRARYHLSPQEARWIRAEYLRELARLVRAHPPIASAVLSRLRPSDAAAAARLVRERLQHQRRVITGNHSESST